jgi:serine/threonine-protein kinase
VTTPNDPTRSFSPLDAVVAEYLQAVESGRVPSRQELLDRHPELADGLRAFFADLDRVDRVAAPLRAADGFDLDPSGPQEGDRPQQPPTVRYFGDYELLEELAHGGMGVVYKARQVSLNRLVALKLILAGTLATDRDVLRFRTEAESAANLDHPRIVPIFEVGEHEGQQYYSMKFVEGVSLARHPLGPTRDEVSGLVDVARAVHYAHQRGILHRDLKPSNVLVDPQGARYVTDFGLAKRLADSDGSLTETGQMLGTPRYMAPEQAAGQKGLTVAADVYSLGVILYERLTGQTPFAGENVLSLLRQVRETEPPRPSAIRPGLDRDLETAVLKSLDKEPARRYPSAEALAEDLSSWLEGRPISARPVSQAERAWRWCRRNPVVSTLATALVVALVTGLLGVATQWWRAERHLREVRHQRALLGDNFRREVAARLALEEANARERQARRRAEARFRLGMKAVDGYSALALEDELQKGPRLEGLRKRLLGSALKFYTELQESLEADPTPQALHDLSEAYFRVGDIHMELGSLHEALAAFRRVLAIRKALAVNPDDPRDQRHLCQSEGELALVLIKTGEHTNAASLIEDLSSRLPDDPRFYNLAAVRFVQCAEAAGQDQALPEQLRRKLADDRSSRAIDVLKDGVDKKVITSADQLNLEELRLLNGRDDFKALLKRLNPAGCPAPDNGLPFAGGRPTTRVPAGRREVAG